MTEPADGLRLQVGGRTRPRRNARPTTGRTLTPAYVDEVGAVGHTCGVMCSFVLAAALDALLLT